MINTIKLLTESILQVPLNTYSGDFTFIVNGTRYATNKIISDLLSPKISRMHNNDSSMNEFIINTKNSGNFQHILDLTNFLEIHMSKQEENFISEIFEILETEKICY